MENEQEQKNIKADFEILFQKYSDVVYRLCLYKTSNTEVAYDLTQETFLRLWKTMSTNKSLDRPKQYLYQIARNLIIDHYRSKKAVSLDLMRENGFEPQSQSTSAELASDISILKEFIRSLDKEFREVVYMRFIEEMSVKDIAEALGISENLASVRINRGKKKLNEKFEI